MSRNYDNWERLVAAVLKREQIWQLCHQDSITTCSDSFADSDFGLRWFAGPVSLGNFEITDIFKLVRQLGRGATGTRTSLVEVSQDAQQYIGTGSRAVIKRANTVDLTENEFEQRMIVLGNCRHQNVGTPRAYYCAESEMENLLLVYDYYTQGSVFDMLKGKGSSSPNWESRVKIAEGAALGIAHIHAQSLLHGNIKSSNIFVNLQGDVCVSDFGLIKKSASEEDDVYGFGLLLGELVTGESPIKASLLNWLRYFEPSEGGFERRLYIVDELDMVGCFPFVDSGVDMSADGVQQEIHKMLRVAKSCLYMLPEEQPSMSDVVVNIADLRSRHHNPQPQPQPQPVEKKQPLRNRFIRFGR